MGFIDDDILESATGQFLVQAGSGKVHITRHNLAFFDDRLANEMLRAAPLVSGNDVFVAVNVLDGGFEMVEVAAASVSLVTEHHPGPLAVAHRAGTAVGQ